MRALLIACLGWLAACTTPEPPPQVVTSPPGLPDPTAVAKALVSGPLAGGAGVWIDGRRHGSLRAALLSAADGDRLELEPGLHAGPIEITRSIEIAPRSADGVTIIDSRTPVAVRVRRGARVGLRHLTIQASGTHRPDAEAAVVVQAAALEMTACQITSERSGGIQVLSGTLDAEDVTVVSKTWQNTVVIGTESVAELTRCHVEGRSDRSSAVEAWESHCVLKDCDLSAGTASLVAAADSEVQALDCRLTRAGAACLPEALLQMETCIVSETPRGVIVRGDVKLVQNRLQDNQVAVVLAGPLAQLTLMGNISTANGAWLNLTEGATADQVENLALTEGR